MRMTTIRIQTIKDGSFVLIRERLNDPKEIGVAPKPINTQPSLVAVPQSQSDNGIIAPP